MDVQTVIREPCAEGLLGEGAVGGGVEEGGLGGALVSSWVGEEKGLG